MGAINGPHQVWSLALKTQGLVTFFGRLLGSISQAHISRKISSLFFKTVCITGCIGFSALSSELDASWRLWIHKLLFHCTATRLTIRDGWRPHCTGTTSRRFLTSGLQLGPHKHQRVKQNLKCFVHRSMEVRTWPFQKLLGWDAFILRHALS